MRYNTHRVSKTPKGVTLVELMVVIAILSVLAAIAIPAYEGYVREGQFTALRANMNGLRTVIEDFRLENGNYGSTGNLVDLSAIDGRFGWEPGTDISNQSYTVAVVSTSIYHVWGQFGSGAWVRCENRFSNCCDSEAGGSGPSAACP